MLDTALPVPPDLSKIEVALAIWLAQQIQHVPRAYVQAKLLELSGYEWSWIDIQQVKKKPTFRQYMLSLRNRRKEGLAAVREQFEAKNIPAAVSFHEEAIKLARKRKDYKAAPALLEPAVKVLYPRHVEDQPPAQITINLGTFAQRYARAAFEVPQEVEVEELPPALPAEIE